MDTDCERKSYERSYKSSINSGVLLNDNRAIVFIHGMIYLIAICVQFVFGKCFFQQKISFKSETNSMFMFCVLIFSSLLIVYEGYEDVTDTLQMDDDPLPETVSTNTNTGLGKVDSQVKPMEDDSHSGNCSYDADASNDSIELNLSLDEQQPIGEQSQCSSHTQSNHVPVSNICHEFSFFLFSKRELQFASGKES